MPLYTFAAQARDRCWRCIHAPAPRSRMCRGDQVSDPAQIAGRSSGWHLSGYRPIAMCRLLRITCRSIATRPGEGDMSKTCRRLSRRTFRGALGQGRFRARFACETGARSGPISHRRSRGRITIETRSSVDSSNFFVIRSAIETSMCTRSGHEAQRDAPVLFCHSSAPHLVSSAATDHCGRQELDGRRF